MAKSAPAIGNFNAGSLSPDFAGRTDNEKYAVGCDTLQNFIPRIQGPARRRPGSRYVQPVKNSANRTWLRKFIFSQAQAYQIEFGPGYCRFYTSHGQVQVSSVTAWVTSTAYVVGDIRSNSGTNYYCRVSHTSGTFATDLAAGDWYALTGTIYEIPTPYTAGMLTNSDGSCGLQIEQSGDVLYIACAGYWTQTLTRYGATNWQMAAYAPPDGPFLDQNESNTPALYIARISGSNKTVTCYATAPVFDPSDVAGYTAGSPGRLVRIGVQYFNVPTWAGNAAVNAGDIRRYNGNTYKALNSATTGPAPPIHYAGTQWDGASGVRWLYLDSGYGIGQVTAYTSSTQVTLTLSAFAGQGGGLSGTQYYNFPNDVVGTSKAITGITAASPPVVHCVGHGFSVGDPVYLTAVGGMVEITEQMQVITAVGDADHFTLGSLDGSAFTAYTSGGSAIKNASLNWQLGAWGIGRTGYAGSFPAAVSFYADRLFFGAGIQWWGSCPGGYNSHAQDLYSQVTASCAVSGIIAAKDVDSITWMSPANILLIGTRGGEFGLTSIVSSQPLGPGNTQVTRQSNMRSRAIRAEIIGTSNFYVQASGKKVMAQDYNFYVDRYDSTNQNRLANHIAGYSASAGIIDIAWHAEPYETLWAVRSDGILIGYLFDRQDNVTGWHEHTIGGTQAGAAVVECVSVIPAPDGQRDEVWLIVKRTINGSVVRSIEYLEKDYETGDAQNTICYVDMSATYNGSPTTTISGLSYLEGETVSVARDGGGHPDCVVSGGSITLAIAGSVVQVGLACPANLITMRPEGGADVGTAQGKIKRTNSASFRLKNTLGGYAGIPGRQLDLMLPDQQTITLGSPPPLFTGDIVDMNFPGDYEATGQIQIQQAQPFPMEIIGIYPHMMVYEPGSAAP